jgi:hypothetical protein
MDPVSRCENAGQEHASRRQYKRKDKGERRHSILGVSSRADATMAAAGGPSDHFRLKLPRDG